jgi:hypothetical protein
MSMTSTARGLVAAIAIVPCLVVLSPVFLVAVVLLAFVSTVRAFGRLLEPAFVTWSELVEFNRTLGWKPRPNMDGHYLADQDDVFRIVTDSEGWPGRRSLDESDIVVIGDSFAFGYGIDTNRSFAELDPSLRIKAVGAPGYSMVQPVLLMEQLGPRLRGKLVTWFAYLENDLQDNLVPEMRQYRAPFVRRDPASGQWTIVNEHLRPAKWECSNLDARRLFPRFCVPGPMADRGYSACHYLIGRAERACRQAGASLVIVTIPHPMQLTRAGIASMAAQSGRPDVCDAELPDRSIAESCRRHRIPMIAGKNHLSRSDYKYREGVHWNHQGHRRVARLLRRVYESFRSGRLDQLVPHTLEEGTLEVAGHPVSRPAASLDVGRL